MAGRGADFVAGRLQQHKETAAGVTGERLSNEDYFQFQRLFRQGLGNGNIDRPASSRGPASRSGAPAADRYGSRRITVIGLVVLLIAYGFLTTLSTETSALGYILRMVPLGLGMGLSATRRFSAGWCAR